MSVSPSAGRLRRFSRSGPCCRPASSHRCRRGRRDAPLARPEVAARGWWRAPAPRPRPEGGAACHSPSARTSRSGAPAARPCARSPPGWGAAHQLHAGGDDTFQRTTDLSITPTQDRLRVPRASSRRCKSLVQAWPSTPSSPRMRCMSRTHASETADAGILGPQKPSDDVGPKLFDIE